MMRRQRYDVSWVTRGVGDCGSRCAMCVTNGWHRCARLSARNRVARTTSTMNMGRLTRSENLVRSDTIGGEGENDRRKNEVKGLTCGDCMSMRRESSKGILVYTKIQCSICGSKYSKDIQNGIFQVPTR